MFGNWRAKASGIYVRTAKRRTILVQWAVVLACRDARLEDMFDNEDAVEALAEWMIAEQAFSKSQVKEVAELLNSARRKLQEDGSNEQGGAKRVRIEDVEQEKAETLRCAAASTVRDLDVPTGLSDDDVFPEDEKDETMRDEIDKLRQTCEGKSTEMPLLGQEPCDLLRSHQSAISFRLSGLAGKGALTGDRCEGKSQRGSRSELPSAPKGLRVEISDRTEYGGFRFTRFNPGVTGVRRSNRQGARVRRLHHCALPQVFEVASSGSLLFEARSKLPRLRRAWFYRAKRGFV